VIVKVWLIRAHLVMVTITPHDDLLFIRHADSLLSGQWLGDYNQMTLIKEPLYPIFIALSHWLSIPLLLSEHLFYALSCAIFVWAIGPLVRQRTLLLAAFLFLLFNPGSFNYPAVGRVFQLAFYAPLATIVMSLLLGMAIRAKGSMRTALGWSCGLGIGLAVFWTTRGESIFLMPSVAIVFLFLFVTLGGKNHRGWGRPLLLCAIPLLCMIGAVQIIQQINKIKYGVPAVIELTTPEFESAYGGLLRIKSDKERQFFPVVHDARLKAYAASPTFREIEKYLDGPVGEGWLNLVGDSDIPAAFFIWAFRDSVAAAGYCTSGTKALEFYKKMGQEIDAACESGQLDCRIPLTSLVPAWHQDYNALVLPTVYSVIEKTLIFEGFNAHTDPFRSGAPREIMTLFGNVTGEKMLSSQRGGLDVYPEYFTHLNREKCRILEQIGHTYKLVIPYLFPLSLLLLLVNLGLGIKRKRLNLMTVFSIANLTGVMAITAVMTLLTITSYSEIARVMHVSFPLVLLFIISVFFDTLGLNTPAPTVHPAPLPDQCTQADSPTPTP
ncbi:MAG: hypothetical protein V2B20_18005, partial [Pseudomonadota bacterium]